MPVTKINEGDIVENKFSGHKFKVVYVGRKTLTVDLIGEPILGVRVRYCREYKGKFVKIADALEIDKNPNTA